MKLRAGIYARISDKDGDYDKVDVQLARARERIAKEDLTEVAVFTDDDISAFGGKLKRDGFDALLAAVTAGDIDVIVTKEHSRLTRGSAVQADAIMEACRPRGVYVQYSGGGQQHFGTAMERHMFRSMDNLSGLEVELAKERQADRFREERDRGNFLWGRRPFGFDIDTGRVVAIREDEAALIRDAHTRLLGGETIYALVKEWNAAGVLTTAGGSWSRVAFRKMLLRPRNAGLVESKGTLVGEHPELAIVSRDEHDALTHLLTDPSRKTAGARISHLLTGILRCPCGQAVVVTTSTSHKNGKRYSYRVYRCADAAVKPGTHASIRVETADDTVVAHVLRDLITETPETPALSPRLIQLTAELARLTAARQRVQDMGMMEGADLAYIGKQLADLGRQITETETVLVDERTRNAKSSVLAAAVESFRAFLAEHDAPQSGTDWPLLVEQDRAFQAWESIGLDRQRVVLKGYEISLKPGKGADRVDIRKRD